MVKKSLCFVTLVLMFVCSFVSCGHEHQWSEWLTEKPATVLTDGSAYRTCECGERENRPIAKTGAENALQGKWIWKAYPNNPVYMFLSFNGQNVRYGMNMFGEDMASGTWDCTYTVDGTTLKLTTPDGSEFLFTVEDLGNTLKVFDEEGHEYVFSN